MWDLARQGSGDRAALPRRRRPHLRSRDCACTTLNPGVPPTTGTERTGDATTSPTRSTSRPGWIRCPLHPRRLSPAAFRHQLVEMARAADARMVLPEGTEPRTCGPRSMRRARHRPCVLLGDRQMTCTTPPGAWGWCCPTRRRRRPGGRGRAVRAAADGAAEASGVTEDVARDALADPIMVGTMMLRGGIRRRAGGRGGATRPPTRSARRCRSSGTAPGAA